MSFDPVIAAIRFGMGRSPVIADPGSVDDMLARLAGPDRAAEAHPIPGLATVTPTVQDFRDANAIRRETRGTDRAEEGEEAFRRVRRAIANTQERSAMATLARAVTTQDGLRERLTAFWANHFTVRAKQGFVRHLVTPYVADAIRPHLTGRFSDMLTAVVTHPVMLAYLDQAQSVGPNSTLGSRRGRGLNENLARELFELHTLGAGGGYSQNDVTQMAELLTGMTVTGAGAFDFRRDMVEPGPEYVLGREYGGMRRGQLEAIGDALADLAVHPDTARHLAGKLAAHFVADDPPADLVAALEARWRDTGGDLMAVTEALLRHPAAWAPEPRKVKPPLDFMLSALRGLRPVAVSPPPLPRLDGSGFRTLFERPLQEMGQPWEQPPGPDGWPDRAEAWVTPQGMAARITWAMDAPGAVLDALPDPRAFVDTVLGPDAPQAVRFAAGAAESVPEGIGIVLVSAAFQRR